MYFKSDFKDLLQNVGKYSPVMEILLEDSFSICIVNFPFLWSVFTLHFVQKQLFTDVLQNRCSQKFRNIHRKTPVLESLFDKVAGLSRASF